MLGEHEPSGLRGFESHLLRMNPKETVGALRGREESGLETEEIIDFCFSVMRESDDKKDQSFAAVVLAGIVKKGLGKRTEEFLNQNPELPIRAWQVLKSAILRMETF